LSDNAGGEPLSIVVEGMLVAPQDILWDALTDSELIARWFMPSDFEAESGHRFSFKSAPVGDWDGVFEGEVIDAQPFSRLRYSMRGGSPNVEGFGHSIDTVLTWTLAPVANGTIVRLEHSGFTEDSKAVYTIMNGENGWAALINRLAKVVAELRENG
jgi:uncharacterized protein YndB with AHSA1/START domain